MRRWSSGVLESDGAGRRIARHARRNRHPLPEVRGFGDAATCVLVDRIDDRGGICRRVFASSRRHRRDLAHWFTGRRCRRGPTLTGQADRRINWCRPQYVAARATQRRQRAGPTTPVSPVAVSAEGSVFGERNGPLVPALPTFETVRT